MDFVTLFNVKREVFGHKNPKKCAVFRRVLSEVCRFWMPRPSVEFICVFKFVNVVRFNFDSLPFGHNQNGIHSIRTSTK